MTVKDKLILVSIFLANLSFAAVNQNIYNSKGYLVAQCKENQCQYLTYTGLSNRGIDDFSIMAARTDVHVRDTGISPSLDSDNWTVLHKR